MVNKLAAEYSVYSASYARYITYLIPGETLIQGGRREGEGGSVSPRYWICLISSSACISRVACMNIYPLRGRKKNNISTG